MFLCSTQAMIKRSIIYIIVLINYITSFIVSIKFIVFQVFIKK